MPECPRGFPPLRNSPSAGAQVLGREGGGGGGERRLVFVGGKNRQGWEERIKEGWKSMKGRRPDGNQHNNRQRKWELLMG